MRVSQEFAAEESASGRFALEFENIVDFRARFGGRRAGAARGSCVAATI
jgi:hypothetical protein